MNADIRDSIELNTVFNNFKPETVIHFAGLKVVGGSVSNPLKSHNQILERVKVRLFLN
jgi:UDP-glucose 4-epimerase